MSDGPRIPAIPTLYNGVEYRSRLEARWAAFFDLAGWPFQYEPFDLNGWIPDFMIYGDTEVLVEIKPVTRFPVEVAKEIEGSGCEHHVLLLGCAVPAKRLHGDDLEMYGPLGWLIVPEYQAQEWFAANAYCVRLPKGRHSPAFGLCGERGVFYDRITGATPPPADWDCEHELPERLWAQAGNLTQWRGRRSVTDARSRT